MCVRQRSTGREREGHRGNRIKTMTEQENVPLSGVTDTGSTALRGKMLIHCCRARQRNSTLPAVQNRHVWMYKALAFATFLCLRWFTTALRVAAARCLGESHNGSMYCRINGALIWLVGPVCEGLGVCLCMCGVNVCVWWEGHAYTRVCLREKGKCRGEMRSHYWQNLM